MNSEYHGPLDRVTAAEYASWFRALADATRVQIVSLLARRGEPITLGVIGPLRGYPVKLELGVC